MAALKITVQLRANEMTRLKYKLWHQQKHLKVTQTSHKMRMAHVSISNKMRMAMLSKSKKMRLAMLPRTNSKPVKSRCWNPMAGQQQKHLQVHGSQCLMMLGMSRKKTQKKSTRPNPRKTSRWHPWRNTTRPSEKVNQENWKEKAVHGKKTHNEATNKDLKHDKRKEKAIHKVRSGTTSHKQIAYCVDKRCVEQETTLTSMLSVLPFSMVPTARHVFMCA